ncbi:uncharacterized protein LOC133438645 [Cololabis saira]|uniref:uncharacterized protein LOC133438645 n=1 Tax=Cololabis saira TaxID=129043 RepID=UPI002AD3C200|nr:uncharacterized protein LOC133438645 [Cololabis saira]
MPRKGKRSQAQAERWRKEKVDEPDPPQSSLYPVNNSAGFTLPAKRPWSEDEARADFCARHGSGRRHRVLHWSISPFTGRPNKLIMPPESPDKKLVLIVGDSHLRAIVDGFVQMPKTQDLSFGIMSTPGASASQLRTEVLNAVVPRTPEAVCLLAPSNDLTRNTIANAANDFAKLLQSIGNRWPKVFVVDFPPRLTCDPHYQDHLRQEYRRVAARMGVKYFFSATEHFPLSNLALWSYDGVHLSDRFGMAILAELLSSAATEQLRTPPPPPPPVLRVSPRPSPPLRKVLPKAVVRESSPAPASPRPESTTPDPSRWTVVGQESKWRTAQPQEEECFFPLNPVFFSSTALRAMEKVSPSHLSCLADFKPSPKPKKVASSSQAKGKYRRCFRSPVNKKVGTSPSGLFWSSDEDEPLGLTSPAVTVSHPREPRRSTGSPQPGMVQPQVNI